jgi:hypothetical protein
LLLLKLLKLLSSSLSLSQIGLFILFGTGCLLKLVKMLNIAQRPADSVINLLGFIGLFRLVDAFY